jgi:hypothetical protein
MGVHIHRIVVGPWSQVGWVAAIGAGMGSGYDLGYPEAVVEGYDPTEWGEGVRGRRTAERQASRVQGFEVVEAVSLVRIDPQADYTSQQGSASAVVRVGASQVADKTVEGDNLHGSYPDFPCAAVAAHPVDKALHTGRNLACLGVGAWT